MTRIAAAGAALLVALTSYPDWTLAAAALFALTLASLLVWRPRPKRSAEPVTLARVPTRYEQGKAHWSPMLGAGISLLGPFLGIGFRRTRR